MLSESSNTNLLIIDVQPDYDAACRKILPGVQKIIQNSNGGIFIVYNDFGGGDSPTDVYNYLSGEDLDDYDEEYNHQPTNRKLMGNLQRAKYMQKEFGFLRSWMDQGINKSTIIEVIRKMVNEKVYDSRDIDYNSLSEKSKRDLNDFDYEGDNIYLQDFVPIHFLKKISPFYMIGGGRNECLREIELFCNAFNIRYKRIDSLIY
jgi:hypothetical protein